MKRTPAYAVCGADTAHRQAFFEQFCRAKCPLWVNFRQETPHDYPAQQVCSISEGIPPLDAGRQIAARISQNGPDAIWMDWPDEKPMEQLLQTMEEQSMATQCKLRKIVRCGDCEAEEALLNNPVSAIGKQLSQCDLLVLRGSDRKKRRKLRHRVLVWQPDIEVIDWEDRREVSAVLAGRNLLQSFRILLVLVILAAIFAVMSRLKLSIPSAIGIFLGTYLQALPFLLLGILLSSAIQVFVPADWLQRVFPKKPLGGMLFGMLGGFIMPICDCASIPVFRSLVRKGVPLPAAVTFMIAAPIINPVVMLSTYYAFGGNPRIMLTRMGFGILCSMLVGLCFAWDKRTVFVDGAVTPTCACAHAHPVHGQTCGADCEHAEGDEDTDGEEPAVLWRHRPDQKQTQCDLHESLHDHTHEDQHDHGHDHARIHPLSDCDDRASKAKISSVNKTQQIKQRLVEWIAHFRDEFFEVAKFLLIGIGVSTLLQVTMGSKLTGLPITSLAETMLVMMAMAFLLSLCSSSDAVVGKNMGASLPMGAVMSFMVFGPMIDIKNMILMAGSFTKRFMIKLLIVTFVVSFVTVYVAFSLGLGALIA